MIKIRRIDVFPLVGLAAYCLLVANQFREEHEPRLWGNLWRDAYGPGDDPQNVFFSLLSFFGGAILFWLTTGNLAAAKQKIALLALPPLAIILAAPGAAGVISGIYNFETDYTFSAGGQGLLALALFYCSSLMGLRRISPAIPSIVGRQRPLFHRFCVAFIVLVLLLVLLLGLGGSLSAISTYAIYQFHSG